MAVTGAAILGGSQARALLHWPAVLKRTGECCDLSALIGPGPQEKSVGACSPADEESSDSSVLFSLYGGCSDTNEIAGFIQSTVHCGTKQLHGGDGLFGVEILLPLREEEGGSRSM